MSTAMSLASAFAPIASAFLTLWRYSSSRAACITRSFVRADILPLPDITSDAVVSETPARLATSSSLCFSAIPYNLGEV